MSDDGYDGGAGGGDDYDYGGPSFGEETFVCLFSLLSLSLSRDIFLSRMKITTCSQRRMRARTTLKERRLT